MSINRKPLMLALADAVEGKPTLFLTPSLEVTPSYVECAWEILRDTLNLEDSFHKGKTPWHIASVDHVERGWLFFFPEDDLDPSEDVGRPEIVYYPSKTLYVRTSYGEWKRKHGAQAKPVTGNAWQRLLGDD